MVRLVPIVCTSVIVFFQIAHSSTLHGVARRDNFGIFGGHSVSIAQVPYMAEVLHVKRGTNMIVGLCGGSIVHKRFILSAAHCAIDDNNPYRQVFVRTGLFSLIKVEKTYRTKYSQKPYIFSNDICLFKLTVALAFGPEVSLVKLIDENFEYKEGALLTISGWGKTESGKYELRQVTIPLISERICRSNYPSTSSTDTVFCAGSENHGDCKGDSGSPILYDGKQIGLLSAGPIHNNGSSWCGSEHGGIYIKVSKYLQWINGTISKHL